MIDLKKPFTFDRVFRIAVTLAIFWGLILLVRYLSDVLIPFAVAIIFAYFLNPLVKFIEKFVHKRFLAILLSLLLIILVLTLAGIVVIPAIYKEINHLGNIISGIINNSDINNELSKRLPENLWKNIQDFIKKDEVRALFTSDNLFKVIGKFGEKILPGIWGFISGTATFISAVIGSAIILMYLLFILIDYKKIRKNWKDLIPSIYRNIVSEFVEDFIHALNNYFRNQALIALICGVLYAILFSIIGLPLGIILGLFIGLLIMVPYLHMIGLIPAILLGLLHSFDTGINPWLYIGLIALIFVGIQNIEDYILTPRILGKSTGMNPAFIILSITIWGKLLGFFGLIIALPLTYLLITYYRRFLLNVDRQLGPPVLPEDTEHSMDVTGKNEK